MNKKKSVLSKTPGAIRSRRYRAKLKKKKKLANAQMKLDKKLSKVANSVKLGGEVVTNNEEVTTVSAGGAIITGLSGPDSVLAINPD